VVLTVEGGGKGARRPVTLPRRTLPSHYEARFPMLSRLTLARRCAHTSGALAQAFKSSMAYADNPNKSIIEMLNACPSRHPPHLEGMALTDISCTGLHAEEEIPNPLRNKYKVNAFKQAIAVIQKHDEPIQSAEQAMQVRC
jgi:hypothetical protein